MQLCFEKDGNVFFEIEKGQGIFEMYPAINQKTIRAKNLVMTAGEEENELNLEANAGKIHTRVEKNNTQEWTISVALNEVKESIHTYSVFYEAELCGLSGVYQAGHGMGDPVGYYAAENLPEKLNSYGIIGLKFGEKSVTLYAKDFSHYRIVFCVEKKNGKIVLSCGIELENTITDSVKLPEIKITGNGNLQEQLRFAAKEIGAQMNARTPKDPSYMWCSWYYDYYNFSMDQLESYLKGFESWEYAHDLKYIQIDNCYLPSLGDWLLPNHRFPNGLKPAFDLIKSYGYRPAVWVGIFMVGNRSTLYREHPDWILHDLDGKPVVELEFYGEERLFGCPDEEYYVLDTSHPDALAYVGEVFRTMKEWGAELFKTDFMLWGIKDSTKVKRYTPGKTSVEYMIDVLKVIREAIGEETYWLGCIAPFLPFVGYADAMRIGNDVGCNWNGVYSPQNMIRSLQGNIFMNQDLYQIDPDALVLRDFHTHLNQKEVESLVLYSAMSGGCIYTSDPVHRMAENRKDLFHFVKPDVRRMPEQPFLDRDSAEVVLTHKNEQGNGLLYIFNPTDATLKEKYGINDLGFAEDKNMFLVENGELLNKNGGKISVEIPSHGHWLIKVTDSEAFNWNQDLLWKNMD